VNNHIVYGPVPSRRLGRSLGINNIPPKTCSYSCVYCQLGRTTKIHVERDAFYGPHEISRSVTEKVKRARERDEPIDYITFVSEGEPTLDSSLGKSIMLLSKLGIKIAVITNASLIWREDVRRDLQKADWVSIKVDATTPGVWTRVNRPHRSLRLDMILEGIISFARSFEGVLTTETMLIKGVNDNISEIRRVAEFLEKLEPSKAYLAIPTRPPAERLETATEPTINEAYQIFTERLNHVEYLIGYEGNAFAGTGDVPEDLLNITAVHPMREEAVAEFLRRGGAGWEVIQNMVERRQLVELEYRGKKFYMRKLPCQATAEGDNQ
jgi:wyosine [tRNA(Phe)-imidazoG37] synthetase (radical SAM superfamily)